MERKSLFEFNRKKGETRNSKCKACQKVYWAAYYARPEIKQKHIARNKGHNKAHRQELVLLIREAKNKPCKDCGKSYPFWVMQFDHLPGLQKVARLSVMSSEFGSKKAILLEIAKCDVVCANCHADRTHKRRKKTDI